MSLVNMLSPLPNVHVVGRAYNCPRAVTIKVELPKRKSLVMSLKRLGAKTK